VTPAIPSETEAAVSKIALDEIIEEAPKKTGMDVSDEVGERNATGRCAVAAPAFPCRPIGIEFRDATVKLF
jgi:hypothetical protein